MSTSYLQYYDLEKYLFKEVTKRYSENNTLSAFDFFCIIIWKANRAKSKVAQRLLSHAGGQTDLESAVSLLLNQIFNAKDNKARLSVLMETWGFRLPMATAILTVLYPDDFTVYDVRVCEVLNDFSDVANKTNFNTIWERYTEYVASVKNAVTKELSLRDKDRYLWGKSFSTQLQQDIQSSFNR